MKILITNDDGINAPGLEALYNIALGLTSAENILTVAPASEQSGVGHAISYNGPLTVEKLTSNRWAVHGTPADCVIVGISETDYKYDLILSPKVISPVISPWVKSPGFLLTIIRWLSSNNIFNTTN